MNKYDCLVRPIITEKSMKEIEQNNVYTFEVEKKTNKIEIRQAVEKIFNVKVISVHTTNVLPKYKKVGKYEGLKNAYKKAYVKVEKGQKIPAFEI